MKIKNFKHDLFDEIIYLKKVNSTIKQSFKLIKTRQIQGNFLLIAKEQTKGIGRRQREWFSPSGGLWLSANFYGLSVSSNLTIFTGISLHQTLSLLYPQIKKYFKLKWPNDVYFQDKKIAGILTNHYQAYQYHSIGIGINSNFTKFQPELKQKANSLQNVLGYKLNNRKLLVNFFDIYKKNLPLLIDDGLNAEYFNKYSLLKNQSVTIATEYDSFQGISRGINKEGAIMIKMKNGMIQPFYGGTISKKN